MRKLIAALLVVALAGSSYGAMLSAGTREIKVAGLVDFDTADETLVIAQFFYGQFVMDYIEVGLRASFTDSDSQTSWGIGAAAEYNFDLGTEMVPYVGVGVGITDVEVQDLQDDSAIVGSVEGGAKFFLAENIALSGAIVLEWATEDIYQEEEDDFEDTDSRIEVGMRFFF